MKKISTAAMKQGRNISEQKLTIGFDLGDGSNWYCVLDEAGNVLLEQRVSTTPKAMKEVFGGDAAQSDRAGDGDAFSVGESGAE
jgi:transposase